MSPDAVRVKIAEVTGWHIVYRNKDGIVWSLLISPEGQYIDSASGKASLSNFGGIPNYPADLNACAEFEAWLDRDEILASDYAKRLVAMHAGNDFMSVTAKPLARCECFLRTLGLYETSDETRSV